MQLSKLHLHSVGYAAENKALSSHDLEVFPAEVTGYIDGEVTSQQQTLFEEGEDAFGAKYKVGVKSSVSIKASWLSFHSNRKTPPDIRRGMRVFLWRFADVDKYYWTDCNWDDHLKRLETVIWVFSDTTDESTKELTPDNSYYLEISTHTGQITLSTCKANGEPYAYLVQLNTKEGAFTVRDDDGNFFDLDSAERTWTVQNKDETMVKLEKRRLMMFAADAINQKTKAWTLDCETAVTNAGKSVTIKTPTYTANTTTYNVNATTFNGTITTSNFSGIVNVGGMLNMNGGFTASAGGGGNTGTVSIPVTFSAASTFSANITVTTINNITFSTHKHGNGNNGDDTGGPKN